MIDSGLVEKAYKIFSFNEKKREDAKNQSGSWNQSQNDTIEQIDLEILRIYGNLFSGSEKHTDYAL